MARLSHAADYSRLSLASAAVLAATGGRRGRRAAAMGLASVGVDGERRQPRRQAARPPPAPRPRGRAGPGRPPRADAVLDLVSLRPLRRRLRLRDRRRPRAPAGGDPAARTRRPRRLLARPHRRPLPRRRRRRRADRAPRSPSSPRMRSTDARLAAGSSFLNHRQRRGASLISLAKTLTLYAPRAASPNAAADASPETMTRRRCPGRRGWTVTGGRHHPRHPAARAQRPRHGRPARLLRARAVGALPEFALEPALAGIGPRDAPMDARLASRTGSSRAGGGAIRRLTVRAMRRRRVAAIVVATLLLALGANAQAVAAPSATLDIAFAPGSPAPPVLNQHYSYALAVGNDGDVPLDAIGDRGRASRRAGGLARDDRQLHRPLGASRPARACGSATRRTPRRGCSRCGAARPNVAIDTTLTAPPPGLGAGEYLTRVRWEYGQAAPGMQASARPVLAGRVTNPDNAGGPVAVGDPIQNCATPHRRVHGRPDERHAGMRAGCST